MFSYKQRTPTLEYDKGFERVFGKRKAVSTKKDKKFEKDSYKDVELEICHTDPILFE